MTYKEFTIWLEGVLDMQTTGLGQEHIDMIREKMKNLTFATDTSVVGPGINPPRPRC